jgi:hypothetical protein
LTPGETRERGGEVEEDYRLRSRKRGGGRVRGGAGGEVEGGREVGTGGEVEGAEVNEEEIVARHRDMD